VIVFMLIRVTPAGVERSQGPFRSVRDAAVAASRVLNDNANVPKDEAQRFAAVLARKPLDTDWVHTGSGYRFRVVKAA
jgi:hypothetical protein